MEDTMLRVSEGMARAKSGLTDAALAFLEMVDCAPNEQMAERMRHCAQMLQSTSKMLDGLTRSTTQKLEEIDALRKKYGIPERVGR